jgi:hypothetical protein
VPNPNRKRPNRKKDKSSRRRQQANRNQRQPQKRTKISTRRNVLEALSAIKRWPWKPVTRWIIRIIGIIVAVVGLLGGLAAILNLFFDYDLHSVTAEPQEAIDPANSNTVPFYVTNDGTLPIYNVYHECIQNDVGLRNSNGDILNVNITDMVMGRTIAGYMAPSDTVSEFCDQTELSSRGSPTTWSWADITLRVWYQPWPLREQTTEQSYCVYRAPADESLTWNPRATDGACRPGF